MHTSCQTIFELVLILRCIIYYYKIMINSRQLAISMELNVLSFRAKFTTRRTKLNSVVTFRPLLKTVTVSTPPHILIDGVIRSINESKSQNPCPMRPSADTNVSTTRQLDSADSESDSMPARKPHDPTLYCCS